MFIFVLCNKSNKNQALIVDFLYFEHFCIHEFDVCITWIFKLVILSKTN